VDLANETKNLRSRRGRWGKGKKGKSEKGKTRGRLITKLFLLKTNSFLKKDGKISMKKKGCKKIPHTKGKNIHNYINK